MQSRLPVPLHSGLSSGHIPSLDGLRAIAAFLVVFYHFGFDSCPAGLGVLAFFVLSGFLITWLLLKEEERSGSISLKLFYIRRSLRIFPAYYVYWLISVGIFLVHNLLHKNSLFHLFRHFLPQAVASFFYV